MTCLISPAGRDALAALAARRTLYAFDFDGTLAPIVAAPGRARLPVAIADGLARLCRRVAVAIVSGRAAADLRARLPCSPRYLVGNHGGEGLPGRDARSDEECLAVSRAWVAALSPALRTLGPAHGLFVEDKGLTLSLHYRQARDRGAALRAAQAAIAPLWPPPRVISGKCVLNLLPPGAPDKWEALSALARLDGTESVLYLGDDDTDEHVFRRAPEHWVTVRIGHRPASAARWFVRRQRDVPLLLEFLLEAVLVRQSMHN